MKGMLKAEWFKFQHSCFLGVILAIITACAGVSIFTGVYDSAEIAYFNLIRDSMVMILAGAIYSGLILTDDFTNGMLRHYIVSGYKRWEIILAKWIHYHIGCAVFLGLYPLISVLLAAAVQGVETSLIALLSHMGWIFLKSLPLYWSVCSIFFLITTVIHKGTVAMGTSVALSIITIIFTNKLYGDGTSGIAEIMRFSPLIQLEKAVEFPLSIEYGAAFGIALAILAAALGISFMSFRRQEL